ncbi:hypothetical protein KY334_00875, partial [Candidatus Woesearchaeota archaeon]|nr:hypothetical protein [Candidatus Woesearchaeota archaeon]
MSETKYEMTLSGLYQMCDTLGQNSAIALEQKTLDEWFESMVGFRTALSNYHYGKLYRKLNISLQNVVLNFDEKANKKSVRLIWLNEILKDTLSKTLNRILDD